MLQEFNRFFSYTNSRKDFSAKLQYYSILLLSFAIPFNNIAINISLGLLVLGWLIQADYLITIKELLNSPFILALCFLFLLYAIGLFYSTNIHEGYFSLEKKMSFIIFPFLIGANRNFFFSYKFFRKIFLSFTVGCFICSLVCLVRGVYRWIQAGSMEQMFYHELGSIFHLHAVYFSIYISLASFFLLWSLEENIKEWSTGRKVLTGSGIIFFSVMILLLSARMVMVSYFFLLVSSVFYFFYKHKQVKIAVTGSLMVICAAVFAVYRIPFIHERFSQIAHTKFYFSPEENNSNGFTLRLVKWSCSWQGIKENFFSGVGTGDAQDYLQQCYKERNFWGQVFEFNSHNQFLQTGLTVGVFGIFLLFYLLFVPLISAWKKKEFLIFVFLAIIILSSLTESIFERQQGILFFCFFYSVLMRKKIYLLP